MHTPFSWLVRDVRCRVAAAQAAPHVQAITVMRDPMQGAGFVEVQGGIPLVLGVPVSSPLDVDIVFTDMQHIQLMDGATTTVEFGIGNTGNTADLNYRIEFNLSDMSGNLITNDALVVQSTASGGFLHIVNLDLTPLPAVKFHDMHVRVDASFAGPNTGGGLFDLFMAGGAGSSGTGVSGPIRFNRAVVGVWVPEPTTAGLGLLESTPARPHGASQRWLEQQTRICGGAPGHRGRHRPLRVAAGLLSVGRAHLQSSPARHCSSKSERTSVIASTSQATHALRRTRVRQYDGLTPGEIGNLFDYLWANAISSRRDKHSEPSNEHAVSHVGVR